MALCGVLARHAVTCAVNSAEARQSNKELNYFYKDAVKGKCVLAGGCGAAGCAVRCGTGRYAGHEMRVC